ncbi:MAG: molybdenum cofactor guanylyltransferase [Ilumatobacter sp.]|uniref:molybdenum cofactor guanylyltransferase n=1 Tax=Ilumatobacter sp. TaxID=1967498 RepID=UPI0026035A6D|nr:molybdenum cofactor guanylyltransferase [Ilumatobacter sp.]MDJ0769914.1 molybdenum cofactor guanylyltransferase [Ilumatobacter sp.]
MTSHPAGVVLAGGASARMGSDKATLPVDGRPMAVRVADALWEAGCQPVFCQGGDAAALASFGLEVSPDSMPGEGPLPAIHAAIDRVRGDIVVAACDLADLDAATVTALIDRAGAGDDAADVIVATAAGRRHLLSYWAARAAAPLADLIARGTRSYGAALDELAVIEVDVDVAGVRNVNTPGDLLDERER